MTYKLYFFKDSRTGKKRNTGVIATSVEAARKKCKQPPASREATSPAKLSDGDRRHAIAYAVRELTEEEKKTADRGEWVRNRADHGKPEDDNKQGFGMPRKKK